MRNVNQGALVDWLCDTLVHLQFVLAYKMVAQLARRVHQINQRLQQLGWGYLQCIVRMQLLMVKRLILPDPPTIMHGATFVAAPCPPIVFLVFPDQLLRLIT